MTLLLGFHRILYALEQSLFLLGLELLAFHTDEFTDLVQTFVTEVVTLIAICYDNAARGFLVVVAVANSHIQPLPNFSETPFSFITFSRCLRLLMCVSRLSS